MSHAIQINGYICAALLALGMLATFLIPRRRSETTNSAATHDRHSGGIQQKQKPQVTASES
ncbi:hypothetical protein ACIBCU_15370 [Streptomyces sp. NPDC051064]|uniref:hypothetical protein n=1 Tax=Streptomyces sp. NPDC051064 TaxID=3365641 RepID=UPI0037A97FD7